MSRNTDFFDYIRNDVFSDSAITSRMLFSGYSFYLNGRIFAIIFGGELYFKVNKTNFADFEKYKCHFFTYVRAGKIITMPYRVLPEHVLEDKDLVFEWIVKSAGITKT